jgi:hypothetical protein
LEKGKTAVSFGNEQLLSPTASGLVGLVGWCDVVVRSKKSNLSLNVGQMLPENISAITISVAHPSLAIRERKVNPFDSPQKN